MNSNRRAKLAKISDDIQNIIGRLDYVMFEEQSALDGIPENLQMSERYYKMEASIESMEEAIDNLNDAIDKITEASE